MSKQRMKRIIGLFALAAVLFVAAQNIKSIFDAINTFLAVITPIVTGGCLAFVINVPMRFFERTLKWKLGFNKHKVTNAMARPLSLIISLLIIGFVLFMVLGIIMPEVANTILAISNNVPTYANNLIEWSKNLFNTYPQIAEPLQILQIDWKEIGNTLFKILQSSAQSLLGSTVVIASNVVGGIITAFLSLVLSIYILFQKDKINYHFNRALQAFLPIKYAKQVIRISTLTGKIFSSFLAGQCIEACILGFLVFIGMSIFGFPYALMVSVLIAVLSFIPMFGVYVGAVTGAVLIAFQNPISGILFFVMFVVIQQIEGNLIYPHVVGGSVGVSPIIVLVAIIIGGGMFGFVGMIVCVPISAVLCALYKELISDRMKKLKKLANESGTDGGSDHTDGSDVFEEDELEKYKKEIENNFAAEERNNKTAKQKKGIHPMKLKKLKDKTKDKSNVRKKGQ